VCDCVVTVSFCGLHLSLCLFKIPFCFHFQISVSRSPKILVQQPDNVCDDLTCQQQTCFCQSCLHQQLCTSLVNHLSARLCKKCDAERTSSDTVTPLSPVSLAGIDFYQPNRTATRTWQLLPRSTIEPTMTELMITQPQATALYELLMTR
jgi:hypothetical protein